MGSGATWTVVGLIAAFWFLVAAMNLGNGYPLTEGSGPQVIADAAARAIVDLGRAVLGGLAILSLCLVDVGWMLRRLGADRRDA